MNAGDFGSNVLGKAINAATVASALRSGSLPKMLLERQAALQDPSVRAALSGNRLLASALGVGGTNVRGTPEETILSGLSPEDQARLGVEVLGPTASAGGVGGTASMPGRRYFAPNLPPMGPEAQADLLSNLAKIQALTQIFAGGGVTRPQAETLLGFRGAMPAGYPGESTVVTKGGRDFLQGPEGTLYPLTGKGQGATYTPEQIGNIYSRFMGGGEDIVGGTSEGRGRRRRTFQLDPTTGKFSLSETLLPEQEISPSRQAGAGMDLRILDQGLRRKWNQLSPDIAWNPITQRDFEVLAKQQGLVDPNTGQPVKAMAVTTNGQYDGAKFDALYNANVDKLMADELDAALGE